MKISNRPAAAAAFAGALSAALAATGSAHAATVTKTYDFSLSDFVDVIGTNAPLLSTVTGSFSLTLDPAVGVSNDTADIVVNSLSDTHVSTPIGFSFSPGTPLFISVGDLLNGPGLIQQLTNDFVLQLEFAGGDLDAPTLAVCADGFSCGTAAGTVLASGYTLLDHNGAWLARDGSVTVEGGVPEPASWALMLVGFGGLGAMIRRRRRALRALA